MHYQRLRQLWQECLQASQRQLIVFVAVYLALFGPLLTGWHSGGNAGRHLPDLARVLSSGATAPCATLSETFPETAPAHLMPCGATPLQSLPRIFIVPGTFVLALISILLLMIAHAIRTMPLLRVALPPPLDDPPPRYPPRFR